MASGAGESEWAATNTVLIEWLKIVASDFYGVRKSWGGSGLTGSQG